MATNVWKPTAEEALMIKTAAAYEAGITVGAVLLEVGIRFNTRRDTEPGRSINIALVSDDPDWNDTDLAEYAEWREFRAGVPLTEDGRACVDFYIRRRFDAEGYLLGNVTLEYRDGSMRIYGYRPDTMGGVAAI